MERLRELALENGPDVQEWRFDDQREAVVELFEQDEAKAGRGIPDWIPDCLSERIGCEAQARQEVIRALKLDSQDARRLALGELVERALLSYPLDSLAIECAERLADWRAWERGVAA